MRKTTRRRRSTPLSGGIIGALVLLAIVGVAFAAPSLSASLSSSAPGVTAVITGATPAPAETPTGATLPTDNPAAQGTALALLETLPVKGRAPKTGYDRTGDFGTAWLDVDRNGCDTRNDILARDFASLAKSGSCKVTSGILNDPYTGKTIDFVRGNATSPAVQIDHVVPLLNAWETGAQQLTQEQRIALANDPLNLYAVDGPTNTAKSAGDAATWLPPRKDFRCTYVAHQVSVKAAYGLWVTRAEHDAIAGILAGCPGEKALSSALAPADSAR
ncbi:HNH endonuclease family protein [Leifsonia poae]|uniref:HNH endonuclease family protein n=1 Tax=Leifsonia poae TaxID=110933 RepID=UPI003D67D632